MSVTRTRIEMYQAAVKPFADLAVEYAGYDDRVIVKIECSVRELRILAATFNEQPPPYPEGRMVCTACGTLVDGKHTNWLCRFVRWMSRDV